MKRRQASLTDVPYDVLMDIVIRVCGSSNGAKDLALAFSTCKAFRQFAEVGDVLRAVAFDDLLVFHRLPFFQLKEGLVYRCAQAGQLKAQFLLSKIMLASYSNLETMLNRPTVDRGCSPDANDDEFQENISRLSSFLDTFLPHGIQSSEVPSKFSHYDLAKLFIYQADSSDVVEMLPNLQILLAVFFGEREVPRVT